MKCPVHQLAMGPDGRCVLCRRTAPPARSTGAPERPTARPAAAPARTTAPPTRTTAPPAGDQRTVVQQAGAAIGILLFVVAAAVLWPRRANESVPGAGPAARSDIADAAEAVPPAPPEPSTEPRRVPLELPELLPAPDLEQPSAQAPGAPNGAAPDAAAPADAGGPAKGPTEQQIRAAVRRVAVSVYTTRTCPVCAAARAFLIANQIPYSEKNVETNPTYAGELASLNPNRTVPTFLIDGQIVVGFDPNGLAQIIRSRVERQLGTKLDIRVPNAPR
jgi:glutaredoxin 3